MSSSPGTVYLLDGHFSQLFVVKIVMCVEKTKINGKNAGVGPFFKKQILEGSGFGSVGRAVASNIRDSRFNSSHLQILFSINCIKSVLKI